MVAFAICLFIVMVLLCCVAAILAACNAKGEKVLDEPPFDKDDEFSCTSCANKKTPMCEHCFFFEHPDKTRGKPTYYTRLKNVPLDELLSGKMPREEAVKKALHKFLDADAPIPIALVIEYNKQKEK